MLPSACYIYKVYRLSVYQRSAHWETSVRLCDYWITKPSKRLQYFKKEPEPTKIKQHSDQLSKSKIVGNFQIRSHSISGSDSFKTAILASGSGWPWAPRPSSPPSDGSHRLGLGRHHLTPPSLRQSAPKIKKFETHGKILRTEANNISPILTVLTLTDKNS